LILFAAFNLFWVLESSLFGRARDSTAES